MQLDASYPHELAAGAAFEGIDSLNLDAQDVLAARVTVSLLARCAYSGNLDPVSDTFVEEAYRLGEASTTPSNFESFKLRMDRALSNPNSPMYGLVLDGVQRARDFGISEREAKNG